MMDTRAAVHTGPDARHKVNVSGGVKDLLLVLCLALLIGSVIFLTVWRRVAFVEMGYEIRYLEGRQEALVHQIGKMEIERAMLSSPDRIRQVAGSELRMTDPSKDQVRIVR
jgi:cell division protein FtsL